jgi:hypothetical protein
MFAKTLHVAPNQAQSSYMLLLAKKNILSRVDFVFKGWLIPHEMVSGATCSYSPLKKRLQRSAASCFLQVSAELLAVMPHVAPVQVHMCT